MKEETDCILRVMSRPNKCRLSLLLWYKTVKDYLLLGEMFNELMSTIISDIKY